MWFGLSHELSTVQPAALSPKARQEGESTGKTCGQDASSLII